MRGVRDTHGEAAGMISLGEGPWPWVVSAQSLGTHTVSSLV